MTADYFNNSSDSAVIPVRLCFVIVTILPCQVSRFNNEPKLWKSIIKIRVLFDKLFASYVINTVGIIVPLSDQFIELSRNSKKAVQLPIEQYLYDAETPVQLSVWCGFWSGGVIGPYVFRNESGAMITVNGEWYRAMITEFLWPKLNDMDLDKMWF